MFGISLKITILMPRIWASHWDFLICFAVVPFACKDKKRSLKQVEAAHCTYTKLCGINTTFKGYISVFWISHAHSQTSQDICCVVFALFNVVWATLFLERWKRREAELAYRWGTLDTPAESLEEPRPQFRVRFVTEVEACMDEKWVFTTSKHNTHTHVLLNLWTSRLTHKQPRYTSSTSPTILRANSNVSLVDWFISEHLRNSTGSAHNPWKHGSCLQGVCLHAPRALREEEGVSASFLPLTPFPAVWNE